MSIFLYEQWKYHSLAPSHCFDDNIRVNILRPRQNGRHFADKIFKCTFVNENVWIPIQISLKFVLKCPIDNIPALVQMMAWCQPGEKHYWSRKPLIIGAWYCEAKGHYLNQCWPISWTPLCRDITIELWMYAKICWINPSSMTGDLLVIECCKTNLSVSQVPVPTTWRVTRNRSRQNSTRMGPWRELLLSMLIFPATNQVRDKVRYGLHWAHAP